MYPAVLIDYGCHAFTYRLAAHLSDNGACIRYFANGSLESPNQKSLDDWSRARPKLIRRLDCRKPYGKMSLHRRFMGELEWAGHCTKALSEENPSVILLSCVPLIAGSRIQAWALRNSVPVIYWLQDLQGRAIHDLLGRKLGALGRGIGAFAYLWEQQMLERSRRVITIARGHEKELPRRVRKEGRYELLENWADLEDFPELPADNDWSVRNDLHKTLNVVYSGTLGLKHDLGLFLQLAEHLQSQSNVRVVVVSSGQAADALRLRAKARNLSNLFVLPFQPYGDLPKVLASAAILIAPLDGSAGSFCVPSKVLAYFCAGRPTVIAIEENNPVALTIRRLSAGCVVRPGDSQSFIKAVSDLLQDEESRRAAGNAARNYAESAFGLANVSAKFLEIMERSHVPIASGPSIGAQLANAHSKAATA